MKGYKPEDDLPTKTRSWKVDRAVEAVRKKFTEVHRTPDEYLSLDEGMAQGSSMRNPIYVSLGKAKPLEGFRFFLLVDYETKIVLNFILDNKSFTADNCRGFPGGFVGTVVDAVVSGAMLTGKWHKVMQDNYYQTVDVAVHMRDNRNVLCAGTSQKKYTDKSVYFGNSKRPKPSRQYPKGSLKIAWNETARVYEYAWMDSSAVYFIDPMFGPGHRAEVSRRSSTGDRMTYHVPRLISSYNTYMHGVDVFDQVRKYFGVDLAHPTKKYTVRVFEILFSMILGQAYNIHRYLHGRSTRLLTHTEFKVQLIKGLVDHPIVSPPIAAAVSHDHVLVQYPPGSYGGNNNKRKRVSCRQCPNVVGPGNMNHKRTTNWFCSRCNVGLHPGVCFDTFHEQTSPQYRPPRQVNPLGSPVAAMAPGQPGRAGEV